MSNPPGRRGPWETQQGCHQAISEDKLLGPDDNDVDEDGELYIGILTSGWSIVVLKRREGTANKTLTCWLWCWWEWQTRKAFIIFSSSTSSTSQTEETMMTSMVTIWWHRPTRPKRQWAWQKKERGAGLEVEQWSYICEKLVHHPLFNSHLTMTMYLRETFALSFIN